MMVYEGSELIGFLFMAFAIVLFSGILALVLVPVQNKSLVSINSVFLLSIFIVTVLNIVS